MQILVVLVLVAVAGVGAFIMLRQGEATPQEGAPVVQNDGSGAAGTVPAGTPSAQSYKDGTYTENGTYTSPAGEEHVTVSLTLAQGVVTSATFSGDATNPGSIQNQKKFAEGYTELVVGKPLDAINLTVVNGSSLTPQGFMDAVSKIKGDAQAAM